MHCIKRITDDLVWVGANDRRLAMFEGVYSVPNGVSYNSYLLKDEKTVLFDTVDKAVRQRFLENLTEALNGRNLDYLIIQHMEPDHSSAVAELLNLYPGAKIICNAKTLAFYKQFNDFEIAERVQIVSEGDVLNTGRHILNFIMAPMVHWPEVMVTYDSAEKILFSADAFGCFGALNGALFADEVNFERDYMDEARRYYTNIVGKYGTQVQALLKKAAGIEINLICPLHGFVWRKNIGDMVAKYMLWSNYEPEDYGVMIMYASIYGNTENAAELLACKLHDGGIKTAMFDVSVTPASEIVSAAFKWSHLVFASATYNAGIFVTMEAVINDLVSHNIQNRTVGIIENGSWAAASGGLIKAKLEKCRNIKFTENIISIKSGVKTAQVSEINAMADELSGDFPKPVPINITADNTDNTIEHDVFFKLSYGLFVLTAKENGKDNGCIINTVSQISDNPLRISVTVNKANYTHALIAKTGEFNVSVLTENMSFNLIKQFGFTSGKDTDKFAGIDNNDYNKRTANGIRYITEGTNGVISAKVVEAVDCATHTLFIAEVVQAFKLSDEPSVTYRYYHEHIKPKTPVQENKKSGFICKICNYVYEGNELPADFICPLCKHGVQDFESV
jgi:flavorubredoxin/flavin reductase (DIM6/NTAB) family NADH-FMN oxidoreductase RutF